MLIPLEDTEIGATIQGCRINNLRFADDIVLIAENPEDLQTLVDKVFRASSDYGLKINIQKTEVQVISKRKQIRDGSQIWLQLWPHNLRPATA